MKKIIILGLVIVVLGLGILGFIGNDPEPEPINLTDKEIVTLYVNKEYGVDSYNDMYVWNYMSKDDEYVVGYIIWKDDKCTGCGGINKDWFLNQVRQYKY